MPHETIRPDKTRRRRRARAVLVRWHRRIGLTAAAFFVLLALSGSLLGHADRLGLTRTHAEWPPILALYGRTPGAEPIAFDTDAGWVAWLDGTLFVDGRPAGADLGRPEGAVAPGRYLAVLAGDAILLFGKDGALVERLAGAALPGTPDAIGRAADGGLALRAGAGRFLADDALLDWRPAPDGTAVEWSAAQTLPADRRAALIEAWRGPGPTWDRVIADVHTGRIFGPWGPWAVDVLSLALLALAATGVVQWMRRR